MSEAIVIKNYLKDKALNIFKEKVEELLKIAKQIPDECLQEARIYLSQSYARLTNILNCIGEQETIQRSFIISDNNQDDRAVVSEESNENETDECNTLQRCSGWNNEAGNLNLLSSIANKSTQIEAELSEELDEKSSEQTREELSETNAQVSNVGSSVKKINNRKRHRQSQCLKTSVGETEPMDELIDAGNGKGRKEVTNWDSDAKLDPKDDVSICDVTKLLQCIPGLSNYVKLDSRNVKVLKDVGGNAENGLHVLVELNDGTVQEFKIATDPDISDKTTDMVDDEETNDKTVASDKEKENVTTQGRESGASPLLPYEAVEEQSIMGRRLRTRLKKTEVKRKGRGRPKSENIPAPEVSENGEEYYRCEVCDGTVKTYHALLVHSRIHTGSRPFHCSMCNKSFTTKGNMKAHQMTTHSENKPWKCDYCNKCFKEKKVLKIHERSHTGEKPYSCNVCEKSFSQKCTLQEHMNIHSDHKPHLCDHCGLGFRGLSSLKAHKKRHLDMREFQCELCDKAFVCRNELKRHLVTHSGEKPYTCEVCSKSFTRQSYLKEHMNQHLSVKPFKCFECGSTFSDTMSLHRHRLKHRIRTLKPTSTEPEQITAVNAVRDQELTMSAAATKADSLTLEIPEEISFNDGQSIQLVVDENTSEEDFQKLQSLLLSATSSAEFMMNSQDNSKQLYQVVCVNPDTQEVVGQVQGQEVIIESQSSDISALQYSIH